MFVRLNDIEIEIPQDKDYFIKIVFLLKSA